MIYNSMLSKGTKMKPWEQKTCVPIGDSRYTTSSNSGT